MRGSGGGRSGLYGLPPAFWALWVTVLVLSTGRFVAPLLAAWLSTDRHLDAATIGLVTATYGVGGVVASLAGGFLADRFGRIGVIVSGQLASAVLLVVLARPHATTTLAALLFVYGLTSALPQPALSSLVTRRAPPALRERAYSLYVWALNCGFAIGPAFASRLSSSSFALVFYLEAAMLGVVTVALVPTLRDRGPAPVRAASAALPLRRVVHVLAGDRVLLGFTAIMTLYLVVYLQCTCTLPIVMGQDGLSVASYGMLLSLNGAILCLLQLPVVRWYERLTPTTVLMTGTALTAVGYVVQIFATAWWHYAVAVVLWTLGELGIFPVASTVIADIAPPALLASYQGVYGLNWPIGRSVASVVGGLLLTRIGAQGLWAACVVGLLVTLLLLMASRRERERRSTSGRAAAVREAEVREAQLQEAGAA